MGLFNRKKPVKPDHERLSEMIEEMKNMLDNNKELSAVVLTKNPKYGSSLIQGESEDIYKLLKASAIQDSEFARLVFKVANEIKDILNVDEPPEHIKKIFDEMGGEKSKKITLSDGTQVLAINSNDINNMTDKDVDKIIDEILKETRGLDGEESED